MIFINLIESKIRNKTINQNIYLVLIIFLFLPIYDLNQVTKATEYSIASYYINITIIIVFIINLLTIVNCKKIHDSTDIGDFLYKLLPIYVLLRIELTLFIALPFAFINSKILSQLTNFDLYNRVSSIATTLLANFLFFILASRSFNRLSEDKEKKELDIMA